MSEIGTKPSGMHPRIKNDTWNACRSSTQFAVAAQKETEDVMKQPQTIVIAGGDLRQVYAAQALAQQTEHRIEIIGVPQKMLSPLQTAHAELPDALEADVLVLPIPAVDAAGNVPAPLSASSLELEELLRHMRVGGLILGGGAIPPLRLIQEKRLEYCNYLRQETLSIANAVPTAEGALQMIMEKTVQTIAGSRVLILGYGRIGKVLAAQLHALGAAVTVAARRETDRVWAELAGCSAKCMQSALANLSAYDVILNTAPVLLLDREVLQTVREDALVIDLASRPGGVDFAAAEALGKQVVWALSLPPSGTG